MSSTAARANDAFPGTTITGASGSFTSSNATATVEPLEPAGIPGAAVRTMWYSWTAPTSGSVVVGTCNNTTSSTTNFDTVVGVFTGATVGALTTVGQNDDTTGCASTVNPNYASTVGFTATAGTTYRFRVDGYSGASGNFNFYYGRTSTNLLVTDSSATEGGDTAAFTMSLSTVPNANVTVTIGTSPQCTFAPATLTFTPGNWNVAQTVTATAINDVVVEGLHSCSPASITTSGGNYVGVTTTPPVLTVVDNDALVTIANGVSGNETGPVSATFTVTQSVVTATPTVVAYSVSGTSTSGTDFTAPSGTVTIPAGSTSATITIPVIDDALVEGAESLIVTLTSVTSGLGTLGATVVATNSIADNDTATVSIASIPPNAAEPATAGTLRLTLTKASATPTTVSYTVSGSASSGTDYTSIGTSVVIPANTLTFDISLAPIDDVIVEGPETVIVTLTAATSNALITASGAATNTITDNDTATVSIANTTNGAEAGPAAGTMTVTQTAVSVSNTVLTYTVSGTATSGSDFTALSGTVTILAGATTATISIPVLDDAVLDPAETVIVTLTGVSSGLATLGSPLVATNTITDNEAATVSIANTTQGAEPSTAGVMTVTQTLVSPTNTVIAYTVSGTATSGSDYTALSGTVTILAGATTATINIPVLDDAIVEGSETVIVTLTSVTSGFPTLGATLVATNTIADNDSATVSIANTTNGAEAGPVNGVLTVTQTAVSATPTVITYSVGGTATSGSDYTALSGTVTILAGATTATISIPVLNDAIVEGGETVVVTLTSITSGLATLGTPLVATNTITDNDTATVSIANTTNGAEAGPAAGTMTVTQTAVSVSNTVLTYTVSGTATSGSDFTALSGTVTILAGATTATISIPVLDDAVLDPAETVIVTLTSVSSGLATLGSPLVATNTITDNEAATVSIANTTQGAEPSTAGVMTVTQTLVSPTNTVIAYTVSGTATSGSDYTALSGTVTILAGATTATINIPVLDDAIVEGSETVIVTLTSVTSGFPTLGATLVATNTIADNDSATVSIANTTDGTEAGPVNGVLTVTQTAVSATPTVISYSVGGTATSGSDYTALSGTVTIPAGSTTAAINIAVTNDSTIELSETVTVTLTAVSSGLATLGTPVAATNTIVDNDLATVSIANTTGSSEAGPVNGVLTVTQSAISPTNTVLAYSVAGTATSGSDFTTLSGTVTIPAGSTSATIGITITNDVIVEPSETVIVTLSSVTSGLATLGTPVAATNTIADNDTATVSISNTTNGAEAGPIAGVMTVTQTAVSASDTVIAYTVGGTATSGSDFTALSGTVTILAGATTATINIPVINDGTVELSETVVVTLSSITSGLATLGTPVAATNTIADNDLATVSIANTSGSAEAGPVNGVMTITQSAVSPTNTVLAYTVSGTATSGSDFTALSGTVTILAGATTTTVTIPVLNDAIVEPSETVTVTLTSVTSGLATLGAPLVATNTIVDNDSATVSISNTTNGAETGPAAGVMTLTQTAVSATDTVIAYSVGGTATSGSDYSALSGTVTILAGATTATISIPVLNDAIVEPSETVIVTLTSVTSGLATLSATVLATNTIADNDSATVSISNTTNGAEAGPVAGVMTLTQTAVSSTNTVISYSVGGTATSGSDYTALSGTVTILAGATTATISIPVLNDAIVEPSETVTVTLTSVTSGLATLSATVLATNTIADNDSATVSISNTTNGAEAGPIAGVMTVTQTAVSATNTVISYSVGGTATSGSDYTALSGTVTILAGATTATINIPVLDDAIVEGGETVIVTLTSVSSGFPTLGATLVATNTIADNDVATVSIANTTNGAEALVPTNGVMTVTQTAVSATNTVLTYTVSGTASAGSDYTALSGSVTILAGATSATITIPVIDNLVVEPSETVIVTLTAISGLPTLGSPLVASNTISDNDVASFTISKAVNLSTIAAPGTLNYTISITSTGNVPLTSPVLTDALSNGSPLTLTSGPTLTSGDAAPLGTLDAGETWVYSASYAVSQAKIDAGASITNSATFDTAETAPSTSNTVTTTIVQNPHLKITKSASTHGPVPVGTVITYTYEVENDGNITMTDVTVNDTHNGSGSLIGPTDDALVSVAPSPATQDAAVDGVWDTLAPGDIIKFTATYAVTQHDVDYLQ